MSTTNPVNRTTEWDDLQIKYGNYAPMEKEVKQEELSRKAQDALESWDPLEGKNLKELDELEDDVEEDVLAVYRKKRLAELKAQKEKARFRGVYLVSMDNYVEQVTLGSENNTMVLLHLYEDHVPASEIVNQAWEALAEQHRHIKFCKGKASSILPKFNEKNLPTILIYQDKVCRKQIMGLSAFVTNVSQLNTKVVEFVLAKKFKLFDTDITVDPRGGSGASRLNKYLRRDSSDDEEDEDEVNAADLHTGAGDKGYSSVDLDRLMKLVRK